MVSLGLGACLAAQATKPARAQAPLPSGDSLLYEKWLDLSLNPGRADETAPAPPTGKADEPPVAKSVSLQALFPDPEGSMRVVHGRQAPKGAWPSAVYLRIMKEVGWSGCGGTVIGRRWVLTAGHCAFKREEGGVRLVRAATVYAKSRLRFEPAGKYAGEVLRVRRVVVHPDFKVRSRGAPINDIALLELEADTTVERQKLTAQAGLATFLAPGTTGTIVGWGITTPVPAGVNPNAEPALFPSSKTLVQANLPIAPLQVCTDYIGRPVEAAEFCAGDGKGGTDACNGDSGGPLFVAGHAGEVVQAGIVSYGRGCAQPKTYGFYTSIGQFEAWLRKHVPDVQFALPAEAPPALDAIAGAKPGGPPAPHGQVTTDIVAVPCTNPGSPFKAMPKSAGTLGSSATPGNRIKIGTCIRVHVTSGVAGHLGVFSRNADGKVNQLFPNRISGGKQEGATPTRVRAGQVVSIPGPADAIDLKVSAPLGRAEVIAVVVPDEVGLPEATKPYRGPIRSVENFEGELAEIARQIDLVPLAPRAVGTRQYEVVE
jgi:secreted trypsin-like serine protease